MRRLHARAAGTPAKGRFGPMQEPDQAKRNREGYTWTTASRRYLIGMVIQHPNWTDAEYAKELNREFGGEADAQTVGTKLYYDIYIRLPELKRNHEGRYEWTPERRTYLIALREEHLEWTNQQIADALNEKFGGEADAQMVGTKLYYDIYIRLPELKRKSDFPKNLPR
ncbi:MAG TPA: hypothetical protein VJH24_01260 [Candidatus Bilamarchaeaceae archaeon]|nr:hypothetical protein [Candidatus Bilamarchaeaceae archaeon]